MLGPIFSRHHCLERRAQVLTTRRVPQPRAVVLDVEGLEVVVEGMPDEGLAVDQAQHAPPHAVDAWRSREVSRTDTAPARAVLRDGFARAHKGVEQAGAVGVDDGDARGHAASAPRTDAHHFAVDGNTLLHVGVGGNGCGDCLHGFERGLAKMGQFLNIYSVAKNWNPRYLVRLLLAKETYA